MQTLTSVKEKLKNKDDLPESVVDKCVRKAQEPGNTLDEELIEREGLPEKGVLPVLGECLNLSYLDTLSEHSVPSSFVENVPVKFARRANVIGIDVSEGRHRVALNTPLKHQIVDEVSNQLGGPVEPVLSPRSEIMSAINRAYGKESGMVDDVLGGEDTEEVEEVAEQIDTSQDLLDMANQAPIIKLVNMILFQALEMRASDVHIQPYEEKLQVRYRIDGILYDRMTPPKRLQDAITSRIKVMGDMDIAERRLPQDGRTTLQAGDKEVDVRISCVPTTHGERVVMRLLDKGVRMYELDELGMNDDHLNLIKEMIHTPHGILLDTGPTGSGKTTTLYASLQHLSSTEKNIMTIEDPVEYQLPGVSQIEIAPKKGLTFANGLRSIVRQDPDVIMVGEIRDLETAKIAIQSALTGHLVFSTLHTNDSASAVTRLLDLGVEPYLVSSSIVGVVAQRLIRRICENCRTKYTPEEELMADIGLSQEDLPDDGKLWRGEGCSQCLGTGYYDRTGIYEILPMNERIREQVSNQENASVIKKEAVDRGLRTLRSDGADKVLKGITTIEEVIRITRMDET